MVFNSGPFVVEYHDKRNIHKRKRYCNYFCQRKWLLLYGHSDKCQGLVHKRIERCTLNKEILIKNQSFDCYASACLFTFPLNMKQVCA